MADTHLGPLVLFTKSSIDDTKYTAPNAKMMRKTWMAPKKKYDEEVERQAFHALRTSKEDFVVVFGDRVENYKRRHDGTSVPTKDGQGLQSPPNKPYTAHGGDPEDPHRHGNRFRFPLGAEREHRKKRMQEQAHKEQQLAQQQRAHEVHQQIQAYTTTKGHGRDARSLDHNVKSHKNSTFYQKRRRRVSVSRKDETEGSHPIVEEEAPMKADKMLELMLTNPAKAQAIKDRWHKQIISEVARREKVEVVDPTKVARKHLGLNLRLDNKDSQLRGSTFPQRELQSHRRRVHLARNGETFLEASELGPNFDRLFPNIDVSKPWSPKPTLAHDSAHHDAVNFFMTEQEVQKRSLSLGGLEDVVTWLRI